MDRWRYRLARWVVASICSLMAGVSATEARRLVAIGDVHGEYEGLVRILREADLIDEENRWIGGDATLVQTGDLVDRGSGVRAVMDLLMSLQEQAPAAGGEGIVLMGNHESLNLIGDFRDATREILASFSGPDSEAAREEAWNEWVEWVQRLTESRGGEVSESDPAKKDKWMEEHPPGYFEYHRAMGPNGKYGKWMLGLPVMAKVGDTIFMHAGIGPDWTSMSVDEINELHRREFTTFAENRAKLSEKWIVPWYFNVYEIGSALTYQIKNPPLPRYRKGGQLKLMTRVAEDLNRLERILVEASPLWYRGYTSLPEDQLLEHLDHLEEVHGAHRFVVAHSPMATASITERAEGRVFLIDTGMLASYYKGRPSALEIEGGTFSAIYEGERRVLVESEGELVPAGAATSEVDSSSFRKPPSVWVTSND